MLLPGRDTFDPQYRFGFNGKENDLDFRGVGNITDYGMRVYNARLGKFLSVDPLADSYAWNSPYGYAENDPINYIDIDGGENGTATAQSAPRVTRPSITVTIDPGLIDGRTGGSAAPPPRGQLFNGEINSGVYAPQSKFITQDELNNLIPPNAGAYLNSDGVSMTVYNANGSWSVSLLKSPNPKRQVTWVDRLIWRLRVENEKQHNSTQWSVSIQAYEIITNDPTTLSNDYLDGVNRRLLNGTATENDKLYASEVQLRKAQGNLNEPEKVSFTQGRGENAKRVTVDLPKGYTKTKMKSHGQDVFYNGKNWITPDQDGHQKGATWKMFAKEKFVGTTDKDKRVGTFDANLNRIAD